MLNKINILAAVSAIALLGFLFFQYHWIKDATQVKENNFDISVSNALQNIVSEIERREAVYLFIQSFPGDSTDKVVFVKSNITADTLAPTNRLLSLPDSTHKAPFGESEISRVGIYYSDAPWGIKGVTIKEIQHGSPAQKGGLKVGDVITMINDSNISNAADFANKLQSISLKHPLKFTLRRPSPDVSALYDSIKNDSLLLETVKSRLNVEQGGEEGEPRAISNADIVDGLSQNYNNRYDRMKKIAYDMTYKERCLQDRIGQKDLESMLKKSLKEFNLNLPYQYCLLSSQSKEVVYPEPCQPTKELLNSPYSKPIYYEDFFSQPGELKIFFPTRNRFLWHQSMLVLALSLLFNAIIVSVVFYTFHIIYKQKKLSEMKTDFINNMTHELKTPISTIQLAAEMLTDNSIANNEKSVRRYAGIIHEENQRLQSHVEKVLQFAKTERSALKLNIETIDMHDLIDEVVSKSALRINKEGGSISLHLEADNSLIKGDRMHLTNVLYNLIDNAIKYTNGKPKIEIYTRNIDSQIRVSIKDYGIGMSSDTLKKVFEKFYRVPTGNIHNVKGFGLGLAYAKLIVEAHNGHIRASSRPEKGSIFEFDLFHITTPAPIAPAVKIHD